MALELAVELAPALGARLTLISVANPHDALTAVQIAGGYPGLVVTEEGAERERPHLQAVLDTALETIPDDVDAGGEVVVDFEPKSVILRAALRAALLLIGSRAYGPLGRVLLGEVSSAVLREAECPVLVTPRPLVAGEAEAGG